MAVLGGGYSFFGSLASNQDLKELKQEMARQDDLKELKQDVKADMKELKADVKELAKEMNEYHRHFLNYFTKNTIEMQNRLAKLEP